MAEGQHVRPASPWMAEIAAGLLDGPARVAMHTRLAEATGGIEAARHAHAAGNARWRCAAPSRPPRPRPGPRPAPRRCCWRPNSTRTGAWRPHARPWPPAAPAAAAAAAEATGGEAALARSWAHLATGETAAAAAALDEAEPGPETDQLRLLTAPAADRPALAERIRRSRPGAIDHPGLAAALAGDDPVALADAEAAALAAGAVTTANWCAWQRVTALADAARLLEAEAAAREAAARCGQAGAYSWQTRFLAAAAWCLVLSGTGLDHLIATAQSLADHTLPAVADTLVAAAIALAEADTGALGAARARLSRLTNPPAALGALVDWLEHETAWLDGQPGPEAPQAQTGLVGGLAHITGRWIAYDTGTDPETAPSRPGPARSSRPSPPGTPPAVTPSRPRPRHGRACRRASRSAACWRPRRTRGSPRRPWRPWRRPSASPKTGA
ncbi:hypothetical protein GCM10029992_44850 [Glycomyces albus]